MRLDTRGRWAVLRLALSFVSAVRAAPPEPDIKAALAWWPPQQNVWTPIGWKDHLFRFQVVYNGHLICSPAAKLLKPHTRKYVGQDFQLNFHETGRAHV